MDPVDHNIEKAPSLSRRPDWLFPALIVCAQIVVSIVSYPFLPDMVPSHWNAFGQVNGYMPKLLNAFLYPALSIGLYILLRVLLAISPRLNHTTQSPRRPPVERILAGLLLFMLAIQLLTVAIALRFPVDMRFVLNLLVSVLFIFIGNYLGKLQRNFWAGIRTPWTLANATVWERTHRLGGWLFVATGVLGIVLSFVPAVRLWGLVVLILLVALVLSIYSYLLYRRIEVSGNEPLSPPFDGGD